MFFGYGPPGILISIVTLIPSSRKVKGKKPATSVRLISATSDSGSTPPFDTYSLFIRNRVSDHRPVHCTAREWYSSRHSPEMETGCATHAPGSIFLPYRLPDSGKGSCGILPQAVLALPSPVAPSTKNPIFPTAAMNLVTALLMMDSNSVLLNTTRSCHGLDRCIDHSLQFLFRGLRIHRNGGYRLS